jgi:hypothetical protein
LILTDGIINDYNETVKDIIDCCDLPLSIIIVGLGDANFDLMVKLDGVFFYFVINFRMMDYGILMEELQLEI